MLPDSRKDTACLEDIFSIYLNDYFPYLTKRRRVSHLNPIHTNPVIRA
jgi:hypothetical protein